MAEHYSRDTKQRIQDKTNKMAYVKLAKVFSTIKGFCCLSEQEGCVVLLRNTTQQHGNQGCLGRE